jgi:hypothetical protein
MTQLTFAHLLHRAFEYIQPFFNAWNDISAIAAAALTICRTLAPKPDLHGLCCTQRACRRFPPGGSCSNLAP